MLTKESFSGLRVIQDKYGKRGKETAVLAKCQCGKVKEVIKGNVKKTMSCGDCGIKNLVDTNRKSLIGDTYGFFEIVSETPAGRKGYFVDILCLICQEIKKRVRLNHLKADETRCPCYEPTRQLGSNRKHGFSTKGNQDPFYDRLVKIHRRCLNPDDKNYPNYGGRGITVWEHWETLDYDSIKSFKNYLLAIHPDALDLLEKGYEIDRRNNNCGYQPGNIRLVTPKVNAQNKRNNIYVDFDGEKRAASYVYEVLKPPITYGAFISRLKKGWTLDECLQERLK